MTAWKDTVGDPTVSVYASIGFCDGHTLARPDLYGQAEVDELGRTHL